MHEQSDTIASLATGSDGCIGIVRLSGPGVFSIADEIFHCAAPAPSKRSGGTFVYGHVMGKDGVADEALLLIMRKPRSYTREDMVEIQGHGGRICAQRILRACLGSGARTAEPGEFTKRAFLNGRIDLLQAEAVLDLVRAQSDRSARMALEQLRGGLSEECNRLHDRILSVLTDTEALLDFTEEHILQVGLSDFEERIMIIMNDIDIMLSGFHEGYLLREGVNVVIAGRPNSGKSTLMNALLKTERSIVSETPGTTRDSIEETLIIQGIPVRLIDTAGLRETECTIEQSGIRQTRQRMQQADLTVFLLDASEPMDSDLQKEISRLKQSEYLVVINKTDKEIYRHDLAVPPERQIRTVLLNPNHAEMVRERISTLLQAGIPKESPHHAVISERHRALLENAREQIVLAHELAKAKREENIFSTAIHLRDALESLGYITGRTYHEELLDQIFSRFCIGK